MKRVLHLLSQRPSLTGSGVTLDALAREAGAAGWDQAVLCGVPADDPRPAVGTVDPVRIHTVSFDSTLGAGDGTVPFPVPGMSDVMPYVSTVWSSMTRDELERYRVAWRARLAEVIEREQPTLIHAHHGWIVAGLAKDVAPEIPLVIHTHGTALRQRTLCPPLAEEVATACARADAWVTLHEAHRQAYTEAYGLRAERVHVVGAGYRDDLFRPGDAPEAGAIGYAGKLSEAKGLHPLLDAVARLSSRRAGVVLHVAGSGAGPEAEAIEGRMASMGSAVRWHGRLDQMGLATMLKRCEVFVLPSFYEGLPLVLVEAAACGCRIVATALPGVRGGLAPRLGDALELVDLPAMATIDRPEPQALPDFAGRLEAALERALEQGPARAETGSFTWEGVFRRVEAVWDLLSDSMRRD